MFLFLSFSVRSPGVFVFIIFCPGVSRHAPPVASNHLDEDQSVEGDEEDELVVPLGAETILVDDDENVSFETQLALMSVNSMIKTQQLITHIARTEGPPPISDLFTPSIRDYI